MPELSGADIGVKIDDREIRFLSLDSDPFYRAGFRFEQALLNSLIQFKDSEIQVVLSNIVVGEIANALVDRCNEAMEQLSASLSKIQGLRGLTQEASEDFKSTCFGGLGVRDYARAQFENYQQRIGIEIVQPDDLSVLLETVDRYQSSLPPFEKHKDKKHEFPDAIALLSLEAFAKCQNAMMIVVSEDKGWINYCKESSTLICVKQLADALSLFQNLPLVWTNQLNEYFRSGNMKELDIAIWQSIDRYVKETPFGAESSSYHSYNTFMHNAEVRDVQYDKKNTFLLIEQEGNNFVFAASVLATIEFEIEFVFYRRDWIDKDEINIGSKKVVTTRDFEVEMVFELEGCLPEEFRIVEVSVASFDKKLIVLGDADPDI